MCINYTHLREEDLNVYPHSIVELKIEKHSFVYNNKSLASIESILISVCKGAISVENENCSPIQNN